MGVGEGTFLASYRDFLASRNVASWLVFLVKKVDSAIQKRDFTGQNAFPRRDKHFSCLGQEMFCFEKSTFQAKGTFLASKSENFPRQSQSIEIALSLCSVRERQALY